MERREGSGVGAPATVWRIGPRTRRTAVVQGLAEGTEHRGAPGDVPTRLLVGDQVEVPASLLEVGILEPVPLLRRGRRDFVSIAQRSAKTESSPRRVVPTRPLAAIGSPRSTSSRSANASSSSSPRSQTSWMSPVPSRSVRNWSFPCRVQDDATRDDDRSSSRRSGESSPNRSRRVAAWTGSSTPSAVQADRERALPEPLQRRRRARRTSSSRERPLVLSHRRSSRAPAEPLEGEERLVMVDRRAMRDHDGREPAGRDRRRAPSSRRIRSTIPSTSPAVPKTRPDWIASTVFVPTTDGGASSSTRVSRAARCTNVAAEICRPGAITPRGTPLCRDHVEVRPGAEVDDDRRAAEPREGRERVHDPVGTHLARVVREDRDPGLRARPHDHGLERGTARTSRAAAT